MTAVVHAQLVTLLRRRVVLGAAALAAAFAVVAATSVILSAESATPGGRAPTAAGLADTGGGTEPFALGVSFTGLLVLVTMVARLGGELSHGTMRTLLMREPRRTRLLGGTVAAILAAAAAVLLAAEILTWLAARAIAPSQGIDTSAWTSGSALVQAAGDYATALAVVGAWAALAVALAVLVRSTPLALGIGIAWAGPFEHLIGDGWGPAERWFPGLVLEALGAGGTDAVSMGRALTLAALYATAATAAALVAFRRRDVTA